MSKSLFLQELGNQKYKGPLYVSTILAEVFKSKDISVLDCASGTGLVAEALQAKGFTNITGLDISEEFIKVAEKKGIYKKIVRAFIGTDRMPFDDNEFDAIVCCSGVLPTHISPDAFREWVRILKPGGFFSFSIRRCYLEVMQGEEEFYSKPFADKIDEVLQDLEQNNKVEILPRRECPEYIENSPAYFYVIKVL
ncbi:hypothetical protein BSL78_15095 [Apostichopus japonicus]|uniref:Methyltransferase type 11 domain-containing protein n=1 Tax=Stichopus japonicus TaxID=307972 RepID=A0A2G8KJ55_STIJA|nr:hypothetical protein BSL78_15095 [Apostichopus japonicus]